MPLCVLTQSKAIFYAINNSRDDVVRLFLTNNANLLIKNRKGNTPCGMAEGRLKVDTVELLRQTETQQLQRGGAYTDYTTNWDENGAGGADNITAKLSKEGNIAPGKNSSQGPDKSSLNKLSKRLRDSAGKRGKFEVVESIIEEAGDDFPEVSGHYVNMSHCMKTNANATVSLTRKLVRVGTDGNFTKNALHLAAWKGDPESICLLVEAGTKYGLDLVNTISTGEGNYGKTRTFSTVHLCSLDGAGALSSQLLSCFFLSTSNLLCHHARSRRYCEVIC